MTGELSAGPADWDALKAAAHQAREQAYAPYSGYRVGAALLTVSGEIITGCNVENATYGATCCAEQVAVFRAVASGFRTFRALAILTGGPEPGTPCGICRQVLSEFSEEGELAILCFTPDGEEARFSLGQLLPERFRLP